MLQKDDFFSGVMPPFEPPKHHIGVEIRMISNMIHRYWHIAGRRENEECTATNGWILHYLASNEDRDIYQRDLEQSFNIRRATVSKTICLMEHKGLVERSSVPGDARLKKLVLTEKGRRLNERRVAEIEQCERTLADGISEEELAVFFKVCGKIKQNLSAEEELHK